VPFLFSNTESESMKKIVIFALLALVGCAQLEHGQEQPVISKFSKEKGEYYFTTCAGAVESWSDCHAKAHRTCQSEYLVLSSEDDHMGTKRDLTFQCKK
jgi:hypothetical protein